VKKGTNLKARASGSDAAEARRRDAEVAWEREPEGTEGTCQRASRREGEEMEARGHAGGKDGHNNTLLWVDITPLNIKRSLTCEKERENTSETSIRR